MRRLQEGLAVPARARPLQDLHRGRGPHALERGVERVPEDARGAAAAREVHLRDDRGAQGPGHDPEPLPALRLQAHPHAARSPRACATCSRRRASSADDARRRDPRARGRGHHARRDEPARSGHRLVGGDEAHRRGRRARARRRGPRRAPRAGDRPRRRRRGDVLSVVASLAEQGYDLAHVARDLLAHLRDLVVAKVCAEPGQLLDLADDEARDVIALAARASADDLTRLHQGFSRGFDDIVRAASRAPRSR